jgi:hypothetical protein
LRLISHVSVVDQVIDRMLYGVQNNREILEWETCGSKPGISLSDDGIEVMAKTFLSMLTLGPLCSTDISGWDWSVKTWELEDDFELRRELASSPVSSLWSHLARFRHHAISEKVFCLPDGALVTVIGGGVQASGWYNTSATNSRIRRYVRIVAYLEFCAENGIQPDEDLAFSVVAMGDDAVETRLDDRVYDKILDYGHVVKDVKVFSHLSGVEFCSHVWDDDSAQPLNVDKTLVRFFSHPPDSASYPDWYAQLLYEFRNLKNRSDIDRVTRAHAEWAINNGEQEKAQLQDPSGFCS